MKNPKFKIMRQNDMFVLRVVGTQTRTMHSNLTNTLKAIEIITRIHNNRDVNEKLKS